MHDEHPTEAAAPTGFEQLMSDTPTESTLFTVIGEDPDKQRAIDRSIAAHDQLASLDGVRLATQDSVVIVLHHGFELLDVAGPLHFLAGTGATVHLATTRAAGVPVPSGSGPALVPTTTLDAAPAEPTILLVPGGDTGILLRDTHAMRTLRTLADHARFITSVCSGSIALAAAGLLEGRRATSHWSVRHLLPGYGAIDVDERIVEDGNRITAAGVTAGMDLAIHLAARLCGDKYARFLTLGAEYSPEPPFDAGTPQHAGAELTALSRELLAPLEAELRASGTRTTPSGRC